MIEIAFPDYSQSGLKAKIRTLMGIAWGVNKVKKEIETGFYDMLVRDCHEGIDHYNRRLNLLKISLRHSLPYLFWKEMDMPFYVTCFLALSQMKGEGSFPQSGQRLFPPLSNQTKRKASFPIFLLFLSLTRYYLFTTNTTR